MDPDSFGKSFVYWKYDDVASWFSSLDISSSVIKEVECRRISGIEIVSLINQQNLAEIGLKSKTEIQQLLWSIEERIEQGDKLTGKAINKEALKVPKNLDADIPNPRSERYIPTVEEKLSPSKFDSFSSRPTNLIELDNDKSEGIEIESKKEEKQFSPEIFEVKFQAGEPPHLLLEEFKPGNRIIVKDFPKKSNGEMGAAERDGRIKRGDFVTAVNGVNLEGRKPESWCKAFLSEKRYEC